VLEIPALTARAGDRLFVAGPSGSGKSTLLSLLAAIVTPQQGTVSTKLDELEPPEYGNAAEYGAQRALGLGGEEVVDSVPKYVFPTIGALYVCR
jgi:ABC-type iron transport system FetAB ATPase subunit